MIDPSCEFYRGQKDFYPFDLVHQCVLSFQIAASDLNLKQTCETSVIRLMLFPLLVHFGALNSEHKKEICDFNGPFSHASFPPTTSGERKCGLTIVAAAAFGNNNKHSQTSHPAPVSQHHS